MLGPVTTNINGYTPVSIVTAGFVTSTVGNPSSITLTNLTIVGTFDVLLQITNPSGYNIIGDATLYNATPLYFYIKVVVTKDCVTNNLMTIPTLPTLSIT